MMDFDHDEVFESFEDEFQKKSRRRRSAPPIPPWVFAVLLLASIGAFLIFRSPDSSEPSPTVVASNTEPSLTVVATGTDSGPFEKQVTAEPQDGPGNSADAEPQDRTTETPQISPTPDPQSGRTLSDPTGEAARSDEQIIETKEGGKTTAENTLQPALAAISTESVSVTPLPADENQPTEETAAENTPQPAQPDGVTPSEASPGFFRRIGNFFSNIFSSDASGGETPAPQPTLTAILTESVPATPLTADENQPTEETAAENTPQPAQPDGETPSETNPGFFRRIGNFFGNIFSSNASGSETPAPQPTLTATSTESVPAMPLPTDENQPTIEGTAVLALTISEVTAEAPQSPPQDQPEAGTATLGNGTDDETSQEIPAQAEAKPNLFQRVGAFFRGIFSGEPENDETAGLTATAAVSPAAIQPTLANSPQASLSENSGNETASPLTNDFTAPDFGPFTDENGSESGNSQTDASLSSGPIQPADTGNIQAQIGTDSGPKTNASQTVPTLHPDLEEEPLKFEDEPVLLVTAVSASTRAPIQGITVTVSDSERNQVVTLPVTVLTPVRTPSVPADGNQTVSRYADGTQAALPRATALPETGLGDQMNIPLIILIVLVLIGIILGVRIIRGKR